MSAPEPLVDPDNRLLVDHLVQALVDFHYGDYGADEFPVLDDDGPTELVRDMAADLIKVVEGYLNERARSFAQGPEAGQMIARVLRNVAAEIARTERPDVPMPGGG